MNKQLMAERAVAIVITPLLLPVWVVLWYVKPLIRAVDRAWNWWVVTMTKDEE